MAGELGAIVGKEVFWSPALANEAVQDLDDMLATQPLPDLDRQTLPAEHVDDGESAELLTAAQLVVDEVQAPCLVGTLRIASGLTINDHLATAWSLAPQRQAFFALEPVDQIAPNRPPIALQHDVNAAIAVAQPRSNDLMHALSDRQARISSARLPLRRSMLARQSAGPPLAVAVTRRHIGDNVLYERGPGNFFDKTSCSAALSRLSSATSFFDRAFSSRSCLNSRTWLDSRPAYCFFQR